MTQRVSFAATSSVLHYDSMDDAKNETRCIILKRLSPQKILSRSDDSLASRTSTVGGSGSGKGSNRRQSVASDYMTPESVEFRELFGCSTGNSSQDNPIVTGSRKPSSVYSSKSYCDVGGSLEKKSTSASYTPERAKKDIDLQPDEDLLAFCGKK